MPGAKRAESPKSREAIDSASVQQGTSDHAGGKVSNGGWTLSGTVRISTRQTIQSQASIASPHPYRS